jgi:beta-1,4-mannosyltransferase
VNAIEALRREGRLRVLFLPDYSHSNPYQRLLADALAERGADVVFAPPIRRTWLPATILGTWLLQGRAQVVHLHWTHPYLGGRQGKPTRYEVEWFVLQVRLLRRLGVRVVWTMHNLGSHEGRRRPREMEAHRRLVRACSAVIAHCDAAVDAAIQAYGLRPIERRRFCVIPHGSYLGAYQDAIDRTAARERLGLPQDARVFAFVGAVRAYKGTDELVAAFRALDEPSARLLVAGRPTAPRVEAQLREASAGDDRVILALDFIPEHELQVYLRAADAVVLPFRDILTSGSAILAMSFGVPVIAPRLGCLPTTLPDDAGILYDPARPGALEGALRTALVADLRAMSARALECARDLSWGTIADATLAAYRA